MIKLSDQPENDAPNYPIVIENWQRLIRGGGPDVSNRVRSALNDLLQCRDDQRHEDARTVMNGLRKELESSALDD